MKKYILHVLYVSFFAIIIFGFQYLPLQDYPVLIYQGFVFNQAVFHGFDFGGFFHFHPYIPPNAISTVILGIMDIFADPFVTGKIYLFLLAIALYSGIIRYLRLHLTMNRMAFASIAFFLTINVHLLMCYLNFLTGLAIVFHAIVFIRRRNYESHYLALALVILLIYLCHFATLALFFLYFFFYFLTKKNYRGLIRFGVSAIPALGIFIHYLLTRTLPILPLKEEYARFIDIIHWKFLILFSPLIPFNDFKWVYDVPYALRIADYIFSVVVLLLIMYVVGKNIFNRTFSLEVWLAVSTFLLAVFLPLNFGGVIPAGERVVVFCMVHITIIFYRENLSQTFRKAAFALCFLLGIAAYSYDLWNTAHFDSMIGRNEIPQDAITRSYEKLEGTNGFLHLHFYDDIKQKKPYPFFNIGLFEYPGSDKE
jgi:hypothetical protein